MKRVLLFSTIILLELVSIFSFYNVTVIPHAFADIDRGCGDNPNDAKPDEQCNDGTGGTLKNCCSQGGKRYSCQSDNQTSTVGGLIKSFCKPDTTDPNNNTDKTQCIDKEQTGPCSTHEQCCSTDQKQLVCYPNRNGGKGLCDLPNQDPDDRNKPADKRDQKCIDKAGDKCEGNGGAQDCCKKTDDKHKDFKCVDKDKKPTDDSGTCEFVDNNTGERCLEKNVQCKKGDWKCCGEMTCQQGKCQEGLAEPPSPPCAEGSFKDGRCGAVATAFGKLSTDPEGFVQSMFAVLLAMSGGIALLLIMKSGYLIMTAQGKPEALQSGRDQLIAAIVGLIFLIFSFVLLQAIGFEILKIPSTK